MKKRILFINPAKKDYFLIQRVHMGFSLLGGILSRNGHEVKVVDYAFLRWSKLRRSLPDTLEIINNFQPDIIGISVFTYLYDECLEIIERLSHFTEMPIILGGPHATLFPDDFTKDKRVSYIVRGEAENIILDLINTAKKEKLPIVINSPIPRPQDIPDINLDIVMGSKYVKVYQIQLSRGCPFSCSFCNINLLNSRRVRPRDLDLCVEQIKESKNKYPSINTIAITDDCPNYDKERFKQFLIKFKEIKIGCVLTIDNMRADLLDEEAVRLYKEAGGRNICLGVESGHPEVFASVNKKETLEDIINTARLIRKYKLELGLCFVIGLPGDNLERNKDSVRFANRLRPDYIFWNMCIPWPKTKVYEWFQKNGTIGDARNFSTLIDARVNFKRPPTYSSDFTCEERIKAWLISNLETCSLPIFLIGNLKYLPFNMLKTFLLSMRYKVMRSYLKYIRGLISYKIILMFKAVLERRKIVSTIRPLSKTNNSGSSI